MEDESGFEFIRNIGPIELCVDTTGFGPRYSIDWGSRFDRIVAVIGLRFWPDGGGSFYVTTQKLFFNFDCWPGGGALWLGLWRDGWDRQILFGETEHLSEDD